MSIQKKETFAALINEVDLRVIDRSAIEKLLALDDDQKNSVLMEFSQVFFRTTLKRLENLQQAVKGRNAEVLHHEAHSLKSSCAYMGAVTMESICIHLEKVSKEDPLPDVSTMVLNLENEFKKVKETLENVFYETV